MLDVLDHALEGEGERVRSAILGESRRSNPECSSQRVAKNEQICRWSSLGKTSY